MFVCFFHSQGGGIADLMSILRLVVAEVRIGKEAGPRVFVIRQVVRRKTKSGVIHVVVVNLLRVHGAHQIRHFACVFCSVLIKQKISFTI